MKPQIEKILADIFTRHADRRLDVYKLQVESAGPDEIKLTGKVLTPESLEETRQSLCNTFPGVSINTSSVHILRPAPGPIHTVATTLTDLHVEPSFLSELYTQFPNGTPLEILDEHPEGKWVFVRMSDGYLGWAYKPYLIEGAPRNDHTHIVKTQAAHVCSENRQTCLTRLLMGTRLRVTEERDKWSCVEIDGPVVPVGWVLSLFLKPLSEIPSIDPGADIVQCARSMIGVYYLWGGASPWGIDCSGLAQLTHRLVGYTLPRDADMQFRASTPIEPPYLPGDLFFFHSESNKSKITHVAISTGDWNMIHSSRSRNGVYEENLQSNPTLRDTFAGARTFLPR